jgi:hypothetical protein
VRHARPPCVTRVWGSARSVNGVFFPPRGRTSTWKASSQVSHLDRPVCRAQASKPPPAPPRWVVGRDERRALRQRFRLGICEKDERGCVRQLLRSPRGSMGTDTSSAMPSRRCPGGGRRQTPAALTAKASPAARRRAPHRTVCRRGGVRA